MQEHYTPKGKHLTIDNRRLIERWKNENKSNREIAGLLGKAPQTIHTEVKRGTTLQQVRKGLYKKVYSADYAQTVYQFNRKRSVKKLILTKESVNQALTLLLGEHRILSITADNGSEFKRLSEVFPEEHIYYAHAYSSWERGSNENHNRLIRRWLPKGTKKTTPKEVAFIENWINNYPKKCLDYKSPSEFLLGG
ncbi:transposase-like protein, IS1239 [Streptococcus pneumoniae]|uniref:IS30 family transposase n=1 Tax=Streptococcus pneumoniae TaxID=1313 RepID=UPI000B58E5B4|nr:IS30 family transposase [Streptococcus pneumoniae]SNK92372.1 transposase-like protein, IS1239 [Streptococcus pneumoniae]VLH37725.1 transposase-like protein, IS1239 [Streptococcus pneumoniae]VTB17763.1 transposase-like protein, IS1239 [Streptococcus pneumoniae]